MRGAIPEAMPKICDLHVTGVGHVLVWVNSRDHCDPHVHVGDKSSSWEARIKFSFVQPEATFWNCLSHINPGPAIFDEIVKQLSAGHLRSARREWWRCFSGGIGCCMANRRFEDTRGNSRVVRTADYDPGTDTTTIMFVNGFQRMVRL